jgi:UDP-N-acetylmuramoylalanine--D-glutamate ligase
MRFITRNQVKGMVDRGMQESAMLKSKTLIVGLGKTGLSCARYFAARGVPAAVIDSRDNPPGLESLRSELPDTALFLGRFDPDVFEEAEQLVVSPGVSLQEPLIQQALVRGVPVVGDVELFAAEANAPVVAITGSNGKSTVTSLVGEMAGQAGLRVQVGGNLGAPALDLLDQDAELYVLELSSFQLESTRSLRPAVAVVLNLTPDHMDRYADTAAYAAAKAVVYQGARKRIFNLDDAEVMAMRGEEGDDLFFTLGEPEEGCFGLRRYDNGVWICQGNKKLMPASDLLIPGDHNRANALAALALGSAVGLEMEAMLTALRRFPGLPHRTQFVAEHQGVRWYNDSKGTNVGACVAALDGLDSETEGRTLLIAGGDCKGADFAPLVPVVSKTARAVILMGRDAPRLERVLKNGTSLFHAADMDEAVGIAARQAQPGDRVLLSPACASFDMFKDYEERGRAFVEAVGRLTQ